MAGFRKCMFLRHFVELGAPLALGNWKSTIFCFIFDFRLAISNLSLRLERFFDLPRVKRFVGFCWVVKSNFLIINRNYSRESAYE